jgi:hypothetical protein
MVGRRPPLKTGIVLDSRLRRKRLIAAAASAAACGKNVSGGSCLECFVGAERRSLTPPSRLSSRPDGLPLQGTGRPSSIVVLSAHLHACSPSRLPLRLFLCRTALHDCRGCAGRLTHAVGIVARPDRVPGRHRYESGRSPGPVVPMVDCSATSSTCFTTFCFWSNMVCALSSTSAHGGSSKPRGCDLRPPARPRRRAASSQPGRQPRAARLRQNRNLKLKRI